MKNSCTRLWEIKSCFIFSNVKKILATLEWSGPAFPRPGVRKLPSWQAWIAHRKWKRKHCLLSTVFCLGIFPPLAENFWPLFPQTTAVSQFQAPHTHRSALQRWFIALLVHLRPSWLWWHWENLSKWQPSHPYQALPFGDLTTPRMQKYSISLTPFPCSEASTGCWTTWYSMPVLGQGQQPASASSYLVRLPSLVCCSDLLGLLCGSGVLGSASCWVATARSPWQPCGGSGVSCQASLILGAVLFSLQATGVLRKK